MTEIQLKEANELTRKIDRLIFQQKVFNKKESKDFGYADRQASGGYVDYSVDVMCVPIEYIDVEKMNKHFDDKIKELQKKFAEI